MRTTKRSAASRLHVSVCKREVRSRQISRKSDESVALIRRRQTHSPTRDVVGASRYEIEMKRAISRPAMETAGCFAARVIARHILRETRRGDVTRWSQFRRPQYSRIMIDTREKIFMIEIKMRRSKYNISFELISAIDS